MAEAATIARPYAEAVFGLAQKAGAFAPWLERLAIMARVPAPPGGPPLLSNPKPPESQGQFGGLKNECEGWVEAEIRNAFPLDNAQINGLVADISRRLKRRVQPRVALDRELIGGVRITAGDEVIDGSVRGKLEEMAAALKS